MSTTDRALVPLLPRPVRPTVVAWLAAVGCGVLEAAVHLTTSEPADPAELVLRAAIYLAVVALVLALRSGRAWVRWLLVVLLGGVGTLSLVVEPVRWLVAGGDPALFLADADATTLVIVVLRAAHLVLVLTGLVALLGRRRPASPAGDRLRPPPQGLRARGGYTRAHTGSPPRAGAVEASSTRGGDMKAVVWHDRGTISLDEVPDPTVQEPTDAIVRLTTSAICGTDLHMIRGTFPGMTDGTVLGHEGVGVVEEVGDQVRGFRRGDRVVVPSTICCGACSYCRAGYTAQCDRANPHGSLAGTAIFGGPAPAGPFDGMQAGYVRVPWAGANLIPIPDGVIDEQAIICSDVLPTAWFGAELAEVSPGDTVAVFGAGPVGLLSAVSAWKQGAGRVLVVDEVGDRLEMARDQHAEPIDFSREDPVEVMRDLTNGVGPDRVIDAVGVDAYPPPGTDDDDVEQLDAGQGGELVWNHGSVPSQAIRWAVEGVAKAGTVGVIGVYPPGFDSFPLGSAMNRNLTVHLGNCNHRTVIPPLLDLVAAGTIDPSSVLTRQEPISDAIEAYRVFDEKRPGWVKIALEGLT